MALEPLVFRIPPRDFRMISCAPVSERLDHLMRDREQAAYLKGREEGEKQLGEQLVHQRAEVMDLQQGVLESLRRGVPRVREEMEKALVDLALEVAVKLVDGLAISPEMVEAAVRSALDQIEETSEYTVRLHPDDLELLRKFNSSLLASGEPVDRIKIVAATEITRGGCVIQTCFGVIDTRRETRVELLREALYS